MFVKSLKLRGFRNLKDTHLTLPEGVGVYVLYGANGAGKTNVLEALSLLSPGQGLHRAKLDDITQTSLKQWSLFTTLTTKGEAHKLGMLYSKKRRHMRLDGQDLKQQAALAELGSVLWFTPEMDQLFKGSPAARRRFFDRLTFSQTPTHAAALSRYNRHIQSRAKLLKTPTPDEDWLTLEEAQAAAAAVAVVRGRSQALAALTPFLEGVTLTLKGSAEVMAAQTADDTTLLTLFKAEFAQRRSQDKRLGSTSFGPHRSDLNGTVTSTPLPEPLPSPLPTPIFPMSTVALTPLERTSMGQHKRAMLLILLAAARQLKTATNTAPCLLFDEVATHLDDASRIILYQKLIPLGGQVWLTGTEKRDFAPLSSAQFIRVEEGRLTPEF